MPKSKSKTNTQSQKAAKNVDVATEDQIHEQQEDTLETPTIQDEVVEVTTESEVVVAPVVEVTTESEVVAVPVVEVTQQPTESTVSSDLSVESVETLKALRGHLMKLLPETDIESLFGQVNATGVRLLCLLESYSWPVRLNVMASTATRRHAVARLHAFLLTLANDSKVEDKQFQLVIKAIKDNVKAPSGAPTIFDPVNLQRWLFNDKYVSKAVSADIVNLLKVLQLI